MKIAILSHPTEYNCGVNNVAKVQTQILKKIGFNVINLVLKDYDFERKYGEEKFSKNQILFNFERLILPFSKKKIANIEQQIKGCDAIITHAYPMCVVGAIICEKYNIPHIYFHHGYNTLSQMNMKWKIWMKVDKVGSMYAFPKTSQVFSISNYISKQLNEIFGLESRVIYNCIDIGQFNTQNRDNFIRDKFGIKNNEPFLFNLAHIQPMKGTDLVIKAFSNFLNIQPNAKLIIAGQTTDKKYMEKCRSLANESVVFAGFLSYDELLKCYATADLFVTGTLWEGFNLPLLEAQASGTPVVAFNLCSHPEVVKDGETGLLAKPADVFDFSHCLKKAYDNSRRMGVVAREWAKGFSLDEYSKNLNECIKNSIINELHIKSNEIVG